MEHRLAAIMATDIVGFAGQVSQNEAATIELVETLKRDVIGMQVEAHRGRLFKSMGDGFLAEFSSTIEAVNCAIGIQRAIALQAYRFNDNAPLLVRIGVSIGDVVVQEGDLLGNGVNTAARLEAMAEPGGIAVSGEVMSQISGKIDLPLVDCGYKRLKKTDAPIHVYMTRSGSSETGGFLDLDESSAKDSLILGGCLCGAVRYEIHLPPISTGYCHCRICQKFTGSAMSTWTAFPASSVHFTRKEPRYFASSPIAERGFCSECGCSLTYKLVKPRQAAYLIVFTPSLDDPRNNAPAAHSGMESKMPWLNILDDLPRTRTAESRVLQQAWASVGLEDPDMWQPLVKVPEAF